MLNLFLSVLLQQIAKRGDGCIWYFVNLVMDTTIGILCCYLLHKVIDHIANKYSIEVIILFKIDRFLRVVFTTMRMILRLMSILIIEFGLFSLLFGASSSFLYLNLLNLSGENLDLCDLAL